VALTGWSASNYLTRAASPGGEPVLFSVWAYRTADVAGKAIDVGTSGSGNNQRDLIHTVGATIARVRSTVNGIAQATADCPQDTWSHLAGAFVSATSRECWVDGGNKGSDVTSISPSAPDITRIGVSASTISPWMTAGALAEVSFWNLSGFTATDRDNLAAKLAAGENPLNINGESGQPWAGAMLAYSSLRTTADITDESGGGFDYSMTGTLTAFGSHPVVDRIIPATAGSYAAAGAAAATLLGLVLAAGAAAGSYGVTGANATTLVGRVGQADPGTYAVTGAAADTATARLEATGLGVYSLAGAGATTVYGSPNVVLVADPGGYAVTGAPATTMADRSLVADPGALVVTGAPVDTGHGYLAQADPGAYNLDGISAGTARAGLLVADPGTYAVVGADADLAAGGVVVLPDYPVVVVVADQRVLVDLDGLVPVGVRVEATGVDVLIRKRNLGG
jgi:hypothetical protein